MRKELYIGIFALSLSLMLKQFFTVLEMIIGILLGVSIVLEFIGILPEKIYQKIRWWKKSLLIQMLKYTKIRIFGTQKKFINRKENVRFLP